MSFLAHFNPVLRLLSILGLRPFTFNRHIDRLQCNFQSTLCIFAYFSTFLLCFSFCAYYGYFSAGFLATRFAGTYNISETLEIILNCLIYYATLFAGIICGRKQAQFLNTLSTVNEKLIDEETAPNTDRLPCHELFRHIFVVAILYYLYGVCGIYLTQHNLNVLQTLFNLLLSWQTATIFFTTVYMFHLTVVLLHRFDRVYTMFWADIDDDLEIRKHLYRRARLCQLFENWYRCKIQFNVAFGVQLLLNAVFDLTLLTIGSFSSCMQIWRRGVWLEEFCFVSIFLAPHVIKNGFLIHVLDRLSGQVSVWAVMVSVCVLSRAKPIMMSLSKYICHQFLNYTSPNYD